MQKLSLLFSKDGLQYQVSTNKKILEDHAFYNARPEAVGAQLQEVLRQEVSQIAVVSAMASFTMVPAGFSQHDYGYDLVALNAPVDPAQEELMLSVNKKYGVQFYYTLPKAYYHPIKATKIPAAFNFSGEKFLNKIQVKNRKEVHIHLYKNQCEFFAIDHRHIILYNNLDLSSEVDFLYFIMFTISKIKFGIDETYFMVYGETTENETFISELRKFVKNLKIIFDNLHNRNFILE